MDELGDAILYKVWGINPEEEEVEEEFVAEGEEEDGEVVSVKEFVNRYIEGKLDLSSDAATQGKEGTEGRGVVHGKHILHLAVRENLIEQCKTLIETLHFDVNSKDESGITPLHLSALHTDCTLFHYLLAKGADIDATADSGERLIHVAAVAGNIPLVTLLLQKNAKEAVAVTKEGCTPLHLAVEQNHSALCQLLIDAGGTAPLLHSSSHNCTHSQHM
jgi:ankyrin